MNKNVIVVIDGAAGSCGKAKVAGEIATLEGINLGASVTNCMPNAGHTFVDERGRKTVFRNIPVASVNPNTELFIGPGSEINMNVFIREYKAAERLLKGRPIYIHEQVPLIEARHIAYDKEHIRSGSTFEGCAAASAEKGLRDEKLKFFKTYKNAILCSNSEWLDRLYKHLDNENEYVMLEGSQGCDLSINHSGNYPKTTCRNVSAMQLMADTGIPAGRLLETIMVIRPFPIRISNQTELGININSGGYGTARELAWSEINVSSLFGWYPTIGVANEFKKNYSSQEVLKYLRRCPDSYKEQIFGEDWANLDRDISLVEALELERIVHKLDGERVYVSDFVEIPPITGASLAGAIIDQSEETTVTKRERRIFDLDIEKLKRNVQINDPTYLYLNFFEHINYNLVSQKGNYEEFDIGRAPEEYLNWLEAETGVKIATLGTGAENGSRIIKLPLIKR